jgi:hypothetical protein
MGKMPILAKHLGHGCNGHDNSKGFCPVERPLPVFYMVDYSVMGLLVDRLNEALRTLKDHGFSIEEESWGSEVVIEGPARAREIVRLLQERGISCEMADVVGDMYQG